MRKDFTPSERVAILRTIKRHSHGGDRKSDQVDNCLLDRHEASERAGFGSNKSSERAKAVVDKGDPALVEAMDRGDETVASRKGLLPKIIFGAVVD